MFHFILNSVRATHVETGQHPGFKACAGSCRSTEFTAASNCALPSGRYLLRFCATVILLRSIRASHVVPAARQDGYNDRVKDAWDQNTEKLFDERCVGGKSCCRRRTVTPAIHVGVRPVKRRSLRLLISDSRVCW